MGRIIYDSDGNCYWENTYSVTVNSANGFNNLLYLDNWALEKAQDYYNELKRKEFKKMRGLFQVYVVNPELDDIVEDLVIIANNEENAKLKVVQSSNLVEDIENYDFVVVKLGNIREKSE